MTVRKVPTVEFPTINNALLVSQPYDTIRVGEGNFPETLEIIIKGLRLIGAGKGKTIINGQDLGVTNGITINNELVTIENLTVQNFKGAGIYVNMDENIIHKVMAINNEIGIDIADGNRNMVFKCEINENVGEGLISRSILNKIMHSKMIGNQANGLLVESQIQNNLIYCCLAQKNKQDGFHVLGNECYFISNTAKQNGFNGFNVTDSLENFYIFNKAIENNGNGFVVDLESTLFENISKKMV
ncbi:right-handed parallel beta-helix repeat-containing protein [Chengkuizengella axinellae]|uniref:Right-handed parallel beta-helix repeat-containing protein n=1 Tax=Chengkuizengella axinellae TaxID=3064388 RepID=A0ABT9IY72_9BACL|nr:right-handed parallel beta-helix repeat-containing protein [Chengkuizengella sp. 2205SS18-9]MDP5274082.1 right-handed parallel beta-helix repeat-containing protein [Chengkuizengella sp. 2205SS18-9]